MKLKAINQPTSKNVATFANVAWIISGDSLLGWTPVHGVRVQIGGFNLLMITFMSDLQTCAGF